MPLNLTKCDRLDASLTIIRPTRVASISFIHSLTLAYTVFTLVFQTRKRINESKLFFFFFPPVSSSVQLRFRRCEIMCSSLDDLAKFFSLFFFFIVSLVWYIFFNTCTLSFPFFFILIVFSWVYAFSLCLISFTFLFIMALFSLPSFLFSVFSRLFLIL